jgi:hypothetical protein
MDPRTANMLAERARTGASGRARRSAARFVAAATTWVKTHKVVAWAGLVAAIIAVFGAYDVAITQPELRREEEMLHARKVDRVKADVSTRQVSLEQCLSTIKTESDERWAKACKASRQRVGCSLSGPVMEALDRQESAARNVCLKEFSLTMQEK